MQCAGRITKKSYQFDDDQMQVSHYWMRSNDQCLFEVYEMNLKMILEGKVAVQIVLSKDKLESTVGRKPKSNFHSLFISTINAEF